MTQQILLSTSVLNMGTYLKLLTQHNSQYCSHLSLGRLKCQVNEFFKYGANMNLVIGRGFQKELVCAVTWWDLRLLYCISIKL